MQSTINVYFLSNTLYLYLALTIFLHIVFDLISVRIHNVTPKFIQTIADAGYKDLKLDKYVSLRIHNVNKEFIERVIRFYDGEKPSIDKVISLAIHGL